MALFKFIASKDLFWAIQERCPITDNADSRAKFARHKCDFDLSDGHWLLGVAEIGIHDTAG